MVTGERALQELSRDAGIIEITPKAAWVASSEAEVASALADAKREGMGVTPRGSGTSIPSQSVGGGVILLQEGRLARVKGDGVECEPSLVKAELNRVLSSGERWMPVDPSSYASCSVGGMVANNSSGSRTYKYGSTMDYVKGLHVVLPEEGPSVLGPMAAEEAVSSGGSTGRIARLLLDNRRSILRDVPKVTKNSSGYRLEKVLHDGVFDLHKLFVGSEGTLGVITSVDFATKPRPAGRALLIFETDLPGLDSLAERLREFSPSAIELLDKAIFTQTGREGRIESISRREEPYLVYAEFDSASGNVEALGSVAADEKLAGFEPITFTDPGDVSRAWEVRNESLTAAAEMKRGSKVPVPGVEDLVAPPERLGDLVRFVVAEFERRGLEYITYGHAGDANLHMRPLLDPKSPSDRRILDDLMEESFEAVWKMGGSITGEHGDGILRANYVRRQYPHSFDVMKEVKRVYDPKGLMNPGVKIV